MLNQVRNRTRARISPTFQTNTPRSEQLFVILQDARSDHVLNGLTKNGKSRLYGPQSGQRWANPKESVSYTAWPLIFPQVQMMTFKQKMVSEFMRWWSKPECNPQFSGCFVRPVQYQRGGGMDDEDAVWLIEQSLGHDDVEVVSAVEGDGNATIELRCTDPVTLLRHRVRIDLTVNADQILSVVEQSQTEGAD